MRFVLKILSIFNTIVILLCSIAQFHHHDETGKMVIYSYTNFKYCENHYHESNQNTIDKHHCSHGCHDGNHEKEKSCSHRFSIAKVENKTYYYHKKTRTVEKEAYTEKKKYTADPKKWR